MIIDAHQHLWDRSLSEFDYRWQDRPELAPIRRTFLPEDLRTVIAPAGVDATVLVQTQHNLQENDWALRLADQHDFLAGVVGWVDLRSDACEDQLLPYLSHPKFVGVRHITQDEPDDDFIVRPDVLQGLRILEKHHVPFDLLFYVRHLPHAARLASELPALPMVLDHLGKPEIASNRITDWARTLRDAARHPNLYVKLSGMITEANWQTWTVSDLRPYVDTALECFGPDRCMFGSDWPVCLLAGSYQQVVEAFLALIAELSDAERHAVLYQTAVDFYGLNR